MFKRVEYKYLVAAVYVVGLFMDLLDMTITNTALPTLAKDFHAPNTIEWVVTGYLLSLAAFIPLSGWVGDRFGTKRTFMFALSMFTVGSLLCGLAWNIESLIAFRVLQGVGGGMLTPVGMTMLWRAFPPHERARASSIMMLPTVVAPASGPILGGYLVQYQSWRWLFLMNIPIAIIGLVMSGLVLKEHKETTAGRLDLRGFILSSGGLVAVVYALARVGQHGFGDAQVVGIGAIGLALLLALIPVESRTDKPMIDVRLFRNKLFSSANSVAFVSFGATQGVFFLMPLFLQAERGISPLNSGLVVFPMAIGVSMMAPVAGRLYGRLGPRRMLMIGMVVNALTALAFLGIDFQTNTWWIRGLMLTRGWAMGFTMIPLQAATFATIRPQDTGRASAINNAIRQAAASFGVALMATVLTGRLTAHGAGLGNPLTKPGALLAFHDAFFAGAALAVIGLFAALLIDDKLAAATMRRAPQPAATTAESGEIIEERVPVTAH